MNKSELKTGMRVEFRNGDTYIVLLNTPHNGDVFSRKESWGRLDEYCENLTCLSYKNLDIVKVFNDAYCACDTLNIDHNTPLLWERTTEKTFSLDGIDYSASTLRSLIKKATQKENNCLNCW